MNDAPLIAPRDTQPFRRLDPLARVGLRTTACIAGRSAALACERCASACPRDCLTLTADTLSLDVMACSGCGQCAAACPAGALAVEGFALPIDAPATGITLLCDHMQEQASAATQRIPCLHGLTLNDWLRLLQRLGPRPLRLPIPTHCAGCANTKPGAGSWPDTVDDARHALAAAGQPNDRPAIAFVGSSLPNGNQVAGMGADEAVTERRRFFAGLSRGLAAAVSDAATPPPARAPASHRQPIRASGEDTRELLLHAAQANAHGLPQEAWLPALTASPACRAHGSCARICPTGALRREQGGQATPSRLMFDAWRCIDCAACVRLCPEHALSLAPRAWRTFPAAPVELAAVEEMECTRCGARFAREGDERLCDRCRKSERLARAGFALFNRAARVSPVAPEGP